MHKHLGAFGVDEAKFAKVLEAEVDVGTGGADHLGQGLWTHIGNKSAMGFHSLPELDFNIRNRAGAWTMDAPLWSQMDEIYSAYS